MVIKKTFPTVNAWITSSRANIRMWLKHSSPSISENPVLALLEATLEGTGRIGRKAPLRTELRLQRKLRMRIGSKAE
jgi:hypothetical protein